MSDQYIGADGNYYDNREEPEPMVSISESELEEIGKELSEWKRRAESAESLLAAMRYGQDEALNHAILVARLNAERKGE